MKRISFYLVCFFTFSIITVNAQKLNDFPYESVYYIYGEDCNCTPFDTQKRFQAGVKSLEHGAIITIFSNIADCNNIVAFNLKGDKFNLQIDSVNKSRNIAILKPIGDSYDIKKFNRIKGLPTTNSLGGRYILMSKPRFENFEKSTKNNPRLIKELAAAKEDPWPKLVFEEAHYNDFLEKNIFQTLNNLCLRIKENNTNSIDSSRLRIVTQNFPIAEDIIKGLYETNYIDTTVNYFVREKPSNIDFIQGSPLISYDNNGNYNLWGILNNEDRFKKKHILEGIVEEKGVKNYVYIAPIAKSKFTSFSSITYPYDKFNTYFYPPVNKINGYIIFNNGKQYELDEYFQKLISFEGNSEIYEISKILKNDKLLKNYPLSVSIYLALAQLNSKKVIEIKNLHKNIDAISKTYKGYLLDSTDLYKQYKNEADLLNKYGYSLNDVEKIIILYNIDEVAKDILDISRGIDKINVLGYDSLLEMRKTLSNNQSIIEHLERYRTYINFGEYGMRALYKDIKEDNNMIQENYYSSQLFFAIIGKDEYSKKIKKEFLQNYNSEPGSIIRNKYDYLLKIIHIEEYKTKINEEIFNRGFNHYAQSYNFYENTVVLKDSIKRLSINYYKYIFYTNTNFETQNERLIRNNTRKILLSECISKFKLTVEEYDKAKETYSLLPTEFISAKSGNGNIISLGLLINELSNELRILNSQFDKELQKMHFVNAMCNTKEISDNVDNTLVEHGYQDFHNDYSIDISRTNDFGSDLKIDINISKDIQRFKERVDFNASSTGFIVGDEISLKSFYIIQALKESFLDTLSADSLYVKITGLADGIPYKNAYDKRKAERMFEHNLGKINWNLALINSVSNKNVDESNIYLAYARAHFGEHCLKYNQFDFTTILKKGYCPTNSTFFSRIHDSKIMKIPKATFLRNKDGLYRGFQIEIIVENYYDVRVLDPTIIIELYDEEFEEIRYDSVLINSENVPRSVGICIGLQDGFRDAKSFGVYDAKSMQRVLKENLGFHKVYSLLGDYKSKSGTAIVQAVKDTLNLLVQDSYIEDFILYYSGKVNGDTTLEFIIEDMLVRDLFSYVKKIKAKRKIILFDNAYINFSDLESPNYYSKQNMGSIICEFIPEPAIDSTILVVSLNKQIPKTKEERSYLSYNILKFLYVNRTLEEIYVSDLFGLCTNNSINFGSNNFNNSFLFRKFKERIMEND